MSNRALFLDLEDVTRMERVTRILHQPVKCADNPVIKGENPWEAFASIYGTVIFDERMGKFRIWYLTGPSLDGFISVRGKRALGNITLAGYAESDDGVHWTKPVLNQLDFEGSKANNLIDIGRTNCEGIAVLLDENDKDPDRRYKSFYWEHGGTDTFVTHTDGRMLWGEGEGDGMWVSFSPDGIHWTNCEENPVIAMGSDSTQSLVWDSRSERYVVFGRMGAGGRKTARAESMDCVHFTEPELVFACDEVDEEGTQFYGTPLDLYEGMYVGFPWIYREGVDGTIDTSLAVSRDGIHWKRCLDRQTFLSLDPDNPQEDGMVRITQRIIRRGDTLYLYYGGVQGPHTGKKYETVERTVGAAIGLATIRRDGFISMDANEEGGFFVTKPFLKPNGELYVNVNAGSGSLTASITDDRGRVIDGFASSSVSEDTCLRRLSFAKSAGSLDGREIRLRFDLRSASLYSYWFDETDGQG